jgi:hypothetical protein
LLGRAQTRVGISDGFSAVLFLKGALSLLLFLDSLLGLVKYLFGLLQLLHG